MARDPLADFADAPLFIVPRVLDALRAYRATAPDGAPAALAETLLAGIEAHPTVFWVMKQCQKAQEQPGIEPDARARLDVELDKLMDILGVPNANRVLGTWRN